jgi:hypothetical protein
MNKEKEVENIGKSFILVIEPLEYSVYDRKFNLEIFGLVFGSQSPWLRDQHYDLVIKYLEFWQHHFTPKAIKEIRDNISNFITAKVKREEIAMRFYCALGLLAYYTAISHEKTLAMRKFTALEDIDNPMYYVYIGVNDYNVMEILKKIEQKVAHSKAGVEWKGSCFELIQVSV